MPYLLGASVPPALLLCALAASIKIHLAWLPRQQCVAFSINFVLTCVFLCLCDSIVLCSTVHCDRSRGQPIRAPCQIIHAFWHNICRFHVVPIVIIFFLLLYPFGSVVSSVLLLCLLTVLIWNHLAWLPHQVCLAAFCTVLGAMSWPVIGPVLGRYGQRHGWDRAAAGGCHEIQFESFDSSTGNVWCYDWQQPAFGPYIFILGWESGEFG